MPNKTHEARRVALRKLLGNGPAATQSSLVAALNAAGHAATQSSVSRDLRDIGAVKTRQGYELANSDDADDAPLAAVADLIREIKSAGPNLLVIKTGIGAAQRVALALDRSNWPEVVGNIGGDDTVFVATESATGQRHLTQRLSQSARARSSQFGQSRVNT